MLQKKASARVPVLVLQVHDPSDIAVREYREGADEFRRLSFELNEFLSSEYKVQNVPVAPLIGTYYAARTPSKGNQWCRAKVINIMEGATAYKIVCYLIDFGDEVTVDRQNLRQVPTSFFKLAPQVKSVSLTGIVAVQLKTDLDSCSLKTTLSGGDEWSISAIEFVKMKVTGLKGVSVEYFESSQHQVFMYYNDGNMQQVCLNDELIRERLALPKPMPSMKPVKKPMTFEESQRLEQELLRRESSQSTQNQHPTSPTPYQQLTRTSPAPYQHLTSISPAPYQHLTNTSPASDICQLPMGRGARLLATVDGTTNATISLEQRVTRLPTTVPITLLKSPPRAAASVSPKNFNRDLQSEKDTSFKRRMDFCSSESFGVTSTVNSGSPQPELTPPKPGVGRGSTLLARLVSSPNSTAPTVTGFLSTSLPASGGVRPACVPPGSSSSDNKTAASVCGDLSGGEEVLPGVRRSRRPRREAQSPSQALTMSSSHQTPATLSPLAPGAVSAKAPAVISRHSSLNDSSQGLSSSVQLPVNHVTTSSKSSVDEPFSLSPASLSGQAVNYTNTQKTKCVLKMAGEDRDNGSERSSSVMISQDVSPASHVELRKVVSDSDEVRTYEDSLMHQKVSSNPDRNGSLDPSIEAAPVLLYERPLPLFPSPDDLEYHTDDLKAIRHEDYNAQRISKLVTMFSDVPIRPCCSLRNARLHEKARRHCSVLGLETLSLSQAFVFPALARGCEVIAIDQAFQIDGEDGVALTYVSSIGSLMCDVASYQHLPMGNGPRFLILCASWSKAESIYRHVAAIFGSGAKSSLLVMHGRREAENKLVSQLLNGTDVVVTTPCTFVRLLDGKYTNVGRLCHLVIDDADIITAEFVKELSVIMKNIGHAVRQNPERAANRQVALFSTSWTEGIDRFKQEYLVAPVTVIASRLEAAIACRVKQVVHYVQHEDCRLSEMLRLLETSGAPKIKVVICTQTDDDASNIHKVLQVYNRYCLLACHAIGGLDAVLSAWTSVHSDDSYPVLVVTDAALDWYLNEGTPVMDADYVLHYNMPDHKRKIGSRLHCLAGNYTAEGRGTFLASHMIFSPKDYLAATTIVKLFDRIGEPIPAEIRQLSISNLQRSETGTVKPLCRYLKSFGYCRDMKKCSGRHMILSQLDCPHPRLPTTGDVEFKVTAVRDASVFFGRILRHRDMMGIVHDFASSKYYLDLALQAHFSQPHVKSIWLEPSQVVKNQHCVYEVNDMYHRAIIQQPVSDPVKSFCSRAWVLLIDSGRIVLAETKKAV